MGFQRLEELQEALLELKYDRMECLVEDLEDLSQFQQGYRVGYVGGVEYVLSKIRDILKYEDME